VFESDIALSAQLGGNHFFRRMELLEELNYEVPTRIIGNRPPYADF